jgi:predicted component of type VI protein secretion system
MAAQAPKLVALSDGPNLSLDKPIMLIGRHQECDIQIPSRKISRRHCCIAQVDGRLVVRDLCSTNGIRVNGARVQEGRLNPGDELVIGNYRYQVDYGVSPGPIAPGVAVASQPGTLGEDPLDSCEEPVALAEPEEPPLPRKGSAAVRGFEKKVPPPYPPPLALPQNLPLAPLSDSHMPPK